MELGTPEAELAEPEIRVLLGSWCDTLELAIDRLAKDAGGTMATAGPLVSAPGRGLPEGTSGIWFSPSRIFQPLALVEFSPRRVAAR